MTVTHDRDHLLDWDAIQHRRLSKPELVRHHFPPEKFTIDYALPQPWLNDVAARATDMNYNEILSTTVWLYPGKSEAPAFWLCGIPAVLCDDTARQLEKLNIPFWSPRGYHGAKNQEK